MPRVRWSSKDVHPPHGKMLEVVNIRVVECEGDGDYVGKVYIKQGKNNQIRIITKK